MNDYASFYRQIAELERQAERGNRRQRRSGAAWERTPEANRPAPYPSADEAARIEQETDEAGRESRRLGGSMAVRDLPQRVQQLSPDEIERLERNSAVSRLIDPQRGPGGNNDVWGQALRDARVDEGMPADADNAPLDQAALARLRGETAAQEYSPLGEEWGWLDPAAGLVTAGVDTAPDLVMQYFDEDADQRMQERRRYLAGAASGALDWNIEADSGDFDWGTQSEFWSDREGADSAMDWLMARPGQERRADIQQTLGDMDARSRGFYVEPDLVIDGERPTIGERVSAFGEDLWQGPSIAARGARRDAVTGFAMADTLREQGDEEAAYQQERRAGQSAAVDSLITGSGALEAVPGVGLIDLGLSAGRLTGREALRATVGLADNEMPWYLRPTDWSPTAAYTGRYDEGSRAAVHDPGMLTRQGETVRNAALLAPVGAVVADAAMDGDLGDLNQLVGGGAIEAGATVGLSRLLRAGGEGLVRGGDPLADIAPRAEAGAARELDNGTRVYEDGYARTSIEPDGRIVHTYQGGFTSGATDARATGSGGEAVSSMRAAQRALERDISETQRPAYHWFPGDEGATPDPALQEFYRRRFQQNPPAGYAFSEDADGTMHLNRVVDAEAAPRQVRIGEQVNADGSVTPRSPIDWDNPNTRLPADDQWFNDLAGMPTPPRANIVPEGGIPGRSADDMLRDGPDAGQSGAGPNGPIRVYHGSPHVFDEFDASRIGTGEGNQAFGHGLYFAEAEGTGQSYQGSVAQRHFLYDGQPFDAGNPRHIAAETVRRHRGDIAAARRDLWNQIHRLQRGTEKTALNRAQLELSEYVNHRQPLAQVGHPDGHLYEATLNVRPNQLLDFDAPYSQQPEAVQRAFASLHGELGNAHMEDYYLLLSEQLGSRQAASDALRAAGVRGIRYLDAGSRGANQGTRNYVIFDSADARIVSRDGQPLRNAPDGGPRRLGDDTASALAAGGIGGGAVGLALEGEAEASDGSESGNGWELPATLGGTGATLAALLALARRRGGAPRRLNTSASEPLRAQTFDDAVSAIRRLDGPEIDELADTFGVSRDAPDRVQQIARLIADDEEGRAIMQSAGVDDVASVETRSAPTTGQAEYEAALRQYFDEMEPEELETAAARFGVDPDAVNARELTEAAYLRAHPTREHLDFQSAAVNETADRMGRLGQQTRAQVADQLGVEGANPFNIADAFTRPLTPEQRRRLNGAGALAAVTGGAALAFSGEAGAEETIDGMVIDSEAELPSYQTAVGAPQAYGEYAVQEFSDGTRYVFRIDRSGPQVSLEPLGALRGMDAPSSRVGDVYNLEYDNSLPSQPYVPPPREEEPRRLGALRPALASGAGVAASLLVPGRYGSATRMGMSGGATSLVDTALGGDWTESLPLAAGVAGGGEFLRYGADDVVRRLGTHGEDAALALDPTFRAQRDTFARTLPDELPTVRVTETQNYHGEIQRPDEGLFGGQPFVVPGDEMADQGYSYSRPVERMPTQREQFLDAPPAVQRAWMDRAERPQTAAASENADPDRVARGLEVRRRLGEPQAPAREQADPFIALDTGASVFGEPRRTRAPRAPLPPLAERAEAAGAQGAMRGVRAAPMREIADDLGIATEGRPVGELRKAIVRELGRRFDSTREMTAFLARYGVTAAAIGIGVEAYSDDAQPKQRRLS